MIRLLDRDFAINYHAVVNNTRILNLRPGKKECDIQDTVERNFVSALAGVLEVIEPTVVETGGAEYRIVRQHWDDACVG